MTQRDIEVVRWVHELRFLTARQIHRLCFEDKPSARTWCEQRLKVLFHHGYLGRVPKPSFGLGAPLAVYCLESKGRDLVAELQDVGRREVYWERFDNKRGYLFLEHTLALNDLRINIHLACENLGYELLEWQDERMLRSRAMKDFVDDPAGLGRIPIVPDGWGRVRLADGRRMAFCVELDRGTQDIHPFKRKMRGYLAYWESGAYRRKYETNVLSVLTVVATGNSQRDRRRVEQLVGWTEEERRWARPETFTDLFWFCSLAHATPEAVLSEPIWRVAGRAGEHRLVE